MIKFCPLCGKPMQNNELFCSNCCGSRRRGASEPVDYSCLNWKVLLVVTITMSLLFLIREFVWG